MYTEVILMKILIHNWYNMPHEDNSVEDTTTVTEDQVWDTESTKDTDTQDDTSDKKEESSEEAVEDITTNDNNDNDDDPNNLDASDLDLLDLLLSDTEEETDQPTQPVFFKDNKDEDTDDSSKKDKSDKEDDYIDESTLDDLDKSFAELESELGEVKDSLSQKEKELKESNTTLSQYSDALDKLWDHPILWPLNAKLLKWEDLDIPWYLQKSIEEDLEALPNMDDIAHEKTWTNEIESLQDKLTRSAKNRY